MVQWIAQNQVLMASLNVAFIVGVAAIAVFVVSKFLAAGWFRLWLVASVCWVAFQFFDKTGGNLRILTGIFYPDGYAASLLASALQASWWPPIVFAVGIKLLLLAYRWIRMGFASTSENAEPHGLNPSALLAVVAIVVSLSQAFISQQALIDSRRAAALPERLRVCGAGARTIRAVLNLSETVEIGDGRIIRRFPVLSDAQRTVLQDLKLDVGEIYADLLVLGPEHFNAGYYYDTMFALLDRAEDAEALDDDDAEFRMIAELQDELRNACGRLVQIERSK